MVTSDTQIANALVGRYGPVSTRFRIIRLSQDRAFLGDISDALFDGELQLDNRRATVRTITLVIRPEFLPANFDRLKDLLQLYIQIFSPETDEWVSFSQGIFRLDAPTELHSSNEQELWNVRGADLAIKLLETNTPDTYTVALGENYVSAAVGIFSGLGLPVSIPSTTKITPVIFVWPPQTAYYTIVQELLEGINYYPPWADKDGIFRSRERIDPATETAAIRYSTEDEPRMIDAAANWVKTPQTARFANRAVVAIQDVARAPSSVEATNNDPISPISIFNRGITQTANVGGDRTADQTTMIDIAKYTLQDQNGQALVGAISTFIDPRREAHESYLLKIGANVESEVLWRAINWSIPLRSGDQMRHRLEAATALILGTAVIT